LEGLVTLCKVVNVYDGDTCKIVLELNGNLAKFNCRMAGYDTPEMRPPKSQVDRDKEITAAKKARDRLKELVMNEEREEDGEERKGDDSGGKLIVVRCGEFDKYGRLLTELFLNEGDIEKGVKSVNQMLVDEGHGYEYDGGTKKAFSG
jgi:endonuclease YncB( thermonuclease family)